MGARFTHTYRLPMLRAAAAVAATAVTLSIAPATAMAQGSLGGADDQQSVPQSQQAPTEEAGANYPAATISKVEWIGQRRAALWIESPSMRRLMQVQILVPRDWFAQPTATFPSVLLLDGLRAKDFENGWTLETDIENFLEKHNTVVVLPVGGRSSFYSDWNRDVNGQAIKWETFLMRELPPLLQRDWRTNDKHAIAGLSMGGTAAVGLAQRHPQRFQFVGAYSGYLDTTSWGMPEAIKAALMDEGRFNAEDMWGKPGSEAWMRHDPKLHVDKLVGKKVYVSSGSGNTGPWDRPSALPGIPESFPGYGLEVLTRMTSQTFVNRARKAGVDVVANFRPSGTHSWPYWQFELTQSWPHMATAIGAEVAPQACGTIGKIKELAEADAASSKPMLGPCISDEYQVRGGVAQDFRGAQVFFSPTTGAHAVIGRISGRHKELGGAYGQLGLPTANEQATPDKRGYFSEFTGGVIYWTAKTGAHAVRGRILDHWDSLGRESGELGFPIGEEKASADGRGVSQEFEKGVVFWSLETGAHLVKGDILKAYAKDKYEMGIGFPTSDEIALDGGALSKFEKGFIYWSPRHKAHIIPRGEFLTAYGAHGYEKGELGYPVSSVEENDGVQEIRFEKGVLRLVDGKVEKV